MQQWRCSGSDEWAWLRRWRHWVERAPASCHDYHSILSSASSSSSDGWPAAATSLAVVDLSACSERQIFKRVDRVQHWRIVA